MASVGGRWEGLLPAVRGGHFQIGGRWSVATAASVEGWRRRWCGGAVLHPAACGGAAVGAGDVGERRAMGALLL